MSRHSSSSATASTCRCPTRTSRPCASTGRPKTAVKCSTFASAGWRSGGHCRRAAALPRRCPCRRSSPMRDSRCRPRARRCRPPWRWYVCSATCCATRCWGRGSCRSWPTRRAPSAWPACSARSASTRRSGSSTSRRMPDRCSLIARAVTASCSRRGSPKPARCLHGWRRPRRTACTGFPCCRSTSITRWSASSAWVISSGPRRTSVRGASCSAQPRAARRWAGKGCSTRTVPASSWPPRCRTAAPTTPRSRVNSR